MRDLAAGAMHAICDLHDRQIWADKDLAHQMYLKVVRSNSFFIVTCNCGWKDPKQRRNPCASLAVEIYAEHEAELAQLLERDVSR